MSFALIAATLLITVSFIKLSTDNFSPICGESSSNSLNSFAIFGNKKILLRRQTKISTFRD